MKCKVCGFRLTDLMKKCPMCGAVRGSFEAGEINQNANLLKYYCPSCKAEIIGEHRFCPACRKELSEVAKTAEGEEQYSNNCIKCRAYLPLNAQFCHKCGAKQSLLPSVKPHIENERNTSSKMKETALEVFEYEVRNGKYILTGLKDTTLTDIVIPKVFTEIGEGAFWGCSSLTSVTIPNSVIEIGNTAFARCSNLTSVTIPNSVTEIGNSAFARCSNLTSITIPNSVTKIGKGAFWECLSLTSVTIPNSVIEIGELAFYRCSGLTSITIPNSVTKIEIGSFALCSNLTSITIPNSVIEIRNSAFAGCSDLKNVRIENPKFQESDIKRVFGKSPSFKEVKIGNKIVKGF